MKSWMPFEWIAALRFLQEGRMQSLLIIVGVGVGVAVIVFMSALLSGLQANLVRRTLSSQAHVVLLPAEEVARPQAAGEGVAARVQKQAQRLRSIDQWQQLRARLEGWPEIAAVSPMASGPAFAVRGDASKAVTLLGVAVIVSARKPMVLAFAMLLAIMRWRAIEAERPDAAV